jgi:1-acyl-sn-glycerol-3-phosphate acyltransferase
MRILAIESSAVTASVAILTDDVLTAEYTVNYKKTHSQTLLPMIDEICKMTETEPESFDLIAVSQGPGSFTGLRIGAATGKGIALALDKKMVAVPTLKAMAYNVSETDYLICPVMDARRQHLYTALYRLDKDGKPQEVLAQSLLSYEELIKLLNEKNEPVLFIGNHRSYFDILLTYSRCRRLTGYVAKKEMEKIPLLSTWMKNLYCLFLDRDNMREGLKTILQAIDYVKNGISICIFPEGTRNNGEELSMLPFRDGALKIAEKTGCAIIPISMNNTADIFEAHFPRVKKVHVVIEYGKPIYPKELDKETRKHLGIYCHDLIQDTIKKNASLI